MTYPPSDTRAARKVPLQIYPHVFRSRSRPRPRPTTWMTTIHPKPRCSPPPLRPTRARAPIHCTEANKKSKKGQPSEPRRKLTAGSGLTGRHPRTSASRRHTSERVRHARLLGYAFGPVPDAPAHSARGGRRRARWRGHATRGSSGAAPRSPCEAAR
jgi:hypothetical protein